MVTGGCSGIGAASAAALLELGYRPLLADILPRSAAPGLLLWDEPFDAAEENGVEAGIARMEAMHGPIRGLVNAAGVLGKMHPPARLRMSDWDREMAIDLRGTWLVARGVGRRMAERGRGAIVNVASIAGMASAPAHAYAAAKAAVIGLTVGLAAEWEPRQVRVNAVSPGFTATPALRKGIAAGALRTDELTRGAALGRLVEPEEVGRGCVADQRRRKRQYRHQSSGRCRRARRNGLAPIRRDAQLAPVLELVLTQVESLSS